MHFKLTEKLSIYVQFISYIKNKNNGIFKVRFYKYL